MNSSVSKVFSGHRPDLTPAHIGAILLAGIPILANLLSVFGVYTLTLAEQQALENAVKWGAVSGGVLVAGDAHLRSSRNKHDAAVKVAAFSASTPPPDGAAAGNVDDDVSNADIDGLPSDEDEFAAGTGPDDNGSEGGAVDGAESDEADPPSTGVVQASQSGLTSPTGD